MSFEDKVNDVIGKPYDVYKAHCWHLVKHLVPDAPDVHGTAKSLATSVRHFRDELNNHKLNEIDESDLKNKDIVILGKNNVLFHAGVYYDDGIIHASESGVVYQPMSTIKIIYTNIQGLRV